MDMDTFSTRPQQRWSWKKNSGGSANWSEDDVSLSVASFSVPGALDDKVL